ncbi:MAG: ABC transporter ATP-binding protein [Anaerolineae bacterium]|nr:ABC transporter ATP-binding protein [Anaerolineae bacterium]MDW8070290.1 ABC transporter ATP-binding protein [Anaerolineae bacterium]
MLLEVENLSVYYDSIQALKGISLQVDEGELVTIVGSNGAGKTTTLLTISGILRPRHGTIRFQGQDITYLAPHEIVRRGISHCPEGRQIFTGLTVMENLLMGAYHRRDRERVAQDLAWVQELFPILAARRRQLAGTLSGGEQQMLAIARALMSRPKVLLLDEPSLGLAPMLVDTIFEVIQQLRAQGVTVLLVEQNAYQALRVADRAYVLETGTIKLSGPAQELARNEEVKKAYLGG